MLRNLLSYFRTHTLDEIEFQKLPRGRLLRDSRILVVDDERPRLIDDLKGDNFSVDFVEDITPENSNKIEQSIYDLVLLDYGDVGRRFGKDQGLALLKHIKRVNPSLIIYAYTSKPMYSEQADFFRMADGVLDKDAGVQESFEKIEKGLQLSHSPKNLWPSLLKTAEVRQGSRKDREWQNLYVRGVEKSSYWDKLKEGARQRIDAESTRKIALTIIGKLIDIGILATLKS